MKLIDLTGRKFGDLTVICKNNEKINGQPCWDCLCNCGKKVSVAGYLLRYGITKSCGCRKHKGTNITHHMSKTKLYSVWHSMKQRCYNVNNKSYKTYGARGITVCDEWRYSFENFYEWSIKSGYKEGLSIDRINNDKGYFPENCKWSNKHDQNNNRTVSRFFTYKGKTQNLSAWCEELNLPYQKIWQRIYRLNYSFEQAIYLPDYSYIRKEK